MRDVNNRVILETEMKPAPLQSSAERVQALISEILTYAEDGLFRDVDKEELMELVWYVQDLEKQLRGTKLAILRFVTEMKNVTPAHQEHKQ